MKLLRRLLNSDHESRLSKLEKKLENIQVDLKKIHEECSRSQAIFQDTCSTISSCCERIKKLEDKKKTRVGRPKKNKMPPLKE